MPNTVLDSHNAWNIKIPIDWGGGGCFGSTQQRHWLSRYQRCHLPGSEKWKCKRWLEIIQLKKEGKTSRKKYLWRARDERHKGMVRKLKKSSWKEYQAFIISEHIFSWALNVCQALLICPTWFWTQYYEEVLLSACCSGRNGRIESLSHTCSNTPRSDTINFED